MPKKNIRKIKYFNGDDELFGVQPLTMSQALEREAGGFGPMVITDENTRILRGTKVRFVRGAKYFPVERQIKVIVTDKPHACDWRCMGGARNSECRCECQGRNHGKNSMACEAI